MLFRFASVGAAALIAVDAARLDIAELMAAGENTDFTAHLALQENATINKNCFNERFWPPALAKKYKNGKMVGSGATACVAIADSPLGGKVAIKIGKKNSNLKEWTIECEKLKRIRMNSCKHGVLALHEQYIPTCLGVGQVTYKGQKVNYYAMHAAEVEGISQLGRSWDPNKKVRKMIAAQVVGSIYAMHKSGYAHNDLHGNNIVVSPNSHALQLIDLGDAANVPGWIKDYKRDGNAVWRWLAIAAGCEDNAQWHSHVTRKNLPAQAENFKKCIAAAWNPGADFMTALDTVLTADVKNQRKHHVEELYNTKFIKNNMPPVKKLFPSDHTKGCEKWDAFTWETKDLEAEFSHHYKCDHIPTYQQVGTGKKKKSTPQCLRGRPHKSGGQGHCFTLKAGQAWGCAGAIDWDGFKAGNKPCNEMGFPGGMYDGGCLTAEHPGYRVAKDGSFP